MKYLVTGGYGFIGSHLVDALKGSVTVVNRTTNGKQRVQRKVKEVLKDINDLTVKDLRGIDVIYHLAGTVDNYHILSDPHIDVHTNINGMIHIMELVKSLKKKPKVIFVSTFFVYGNVYEEDGKRINEKSRTDPLALYPSAKLCAENILKCYAKLYNFPYLICRLSNVYGARENPTSKKAALNMLIKKAVNKEPIAVYNGGDFYRDYIYVDDVVRAFMFLENKVKNDTVLIAHGKPVYFKDMIDFIVKKTRVKVTSMKPPEFHKVVGVRNFITDTRKITKLGWKPTIDYKEGISRIIDFCEIEKAYDSY